MLLLRNPVFPPGLANLKRNPGTGLIHLKFIVIFKQVQSAVELSYRTGSWSRSESAGTNSTVKSSSIRSIGHQMMVPYTGGNGQGEGGYTGDRY